MKQYRVKITNRVLNDMEAIYDHIAYKLESPNIALKQYDRIAYGIESLRTFPERCRMFDSEPESVMGMRRLLVDNYTVVYVIEDETVVVLRILYSASDIAVRLREEQW